VGNLKAGGSTGLSGDTKKLVILWAVVIVSYALIVLLANPMRQWRFTPEEKEAIFEELQAVWCRNMNLTTHAELEDMRYVQVFAIQQEHRLTAIDTRNIVMWAVEHERGVEPCFFQAASRTLCAGEDLLDLTSQGIRGSFGLSESDVEFVTGYGFGRGWEAHPCYYEEGLPIP
jgi:hypothetical protein